MKSKGSSGKERLKPGVQKLIARSILVLFSIVGCFLIARLGAGAPDRSADASEVTLGIGDMAVSSNATDDSSSVAVEDSSRYQTPRHEPPTRRGASNPAEETYNKNMAQRKELLAGRAPESLTIQEVRKIFLKPSYLCRPTKRYGNGKTGGKMVCLPHKLLKKKRNVVVYSFGSAGETSFEESLHDSFSVKSHTFDPFMGYAAASQLSSRPFLTFHPYGICAKRQLSSMRKSHPGKMFKTLQQTMRELRHKYVDVLKMDIERGEEMVVPEMARVYGRSPPVGQFLVEIHQAQNARRTLSFVQSMESMGFRLFSAERNPKCRVCWELAYVHESVLP